MSPHTLYSLTNEGVHHFVGVSECLVRIAGAFLVHRMCPIMYCKNQCTIDVLTKQYIPPSSTHKREATRDAGRARQHAELSSRKE